MVEKTIEHGTNGSAKVKRIRSMSQEEFYRVTEFIKENKDRWAKEKPSFMRLSQIVSDYLDIPVTDSQVARICRITGTTWEKQSNKTGANGSAAWKTAFAELSVRLESAIDELTGATSKSQALERELSIASFRIKEQDLQLAKLRLAVAQLYTTAGKSIPKELDVPANTFGRISSSVVQNVGTSGASGTGDANGLKPLESSTAKP